MLPRLHLFQVLLIDVMGTDFVTVNDLSMLLICAEVLHLIWPHRSNERFCADENGAGNLDTNLQYGLLPFARCSKSGRRCNLFPRLLGSKRGVLHALTFDLGGDLDLKYLQDTPDV